MSATLTPPDARVPAPPRRYMLHIVLFLLAFLTTTAAGALYVHPGQDLSVWERMLPLRDGLPYSLPLMLILLCHELGHFFAARAHGVEASLPYFIPLPPFMGLGTMGAIIGMRGITADRRKLIDIGAAGPLAGLAVAVPVTLYGLALSRVRALEPGGLQEGNSILYSLLKYAATGAWLPDGRQDVFLHPTAWAGWAGLFVTMINLLPLAQLDGGHIAFAFFGNSYGRASRLLHRLLPAVAVAVGFWVYRTVTREAAGRPDAALAPQIAFGAASFWVVWFVLVAVLRRASGGIDHPPVEDRPLPTSRQVLFWVVLVVFVLIFMPVPFRHTLAGGVPSP